MSQISLVLQFSLTVFWNGIFCGTFELWLLSLQLINMHSITAIQTHAYYDFSFFRGSTVQDVQMNFQTPNLLYPKLLVAFLPRKMCELSSFSSVLKNLFCLSCISADDIQHLIQSHHSHIWQFLVSSHCKSPPRKTKGLVLQRKNQIGTGLQSF